MPPDSSRDICKELWLIRFRFLFCWLLSSSLSNCSSDVWIGSNLQNRKKIGYTWWPFFKAKMLLHFLLIFHSKILGLNVCITSLLPVEEKQIQVPYFPYGFHFLNWVVIIMRWSKTLLTYILHVRPKLLIFDWGVLCVKNLSFVIDWQCKHLFRYHEKWLQVPN